MATYATCKLDSDLHDSRDAWKQDSIFSPHEVKSNNAKPGEFALVPALCGKQML